MRNVNSVLEVFQQYFMGNILLAGAILSLLLLGFHTGKKYRTYLLGVMLCAGVFCFNDLIFKIARHIGEGETYYRLLWMIPVVVMCAYLLIRMWDFFKEKRQMALVVVICVLIAGLYQVTPWSNWIPKAENIYQIPQDMVEVADIIADDAGERRVIFYDEGELSHGIREYNAYLVMASDELSYIDDIFEKETINVAGMALRYMLINSKIDYLAVKKEDVNTQAVLTAGGCVCQGTSENYIVYYANQERFALETEDSGFGGYLNYEDIVVPGLPQDIRILYLTGAAPQDGMTESWGQLSGHERLIYGGSMFAANTTENTSFWVEELEGVRLVFVQNPEGNVDETALIGLQSVMEDETPAILFLSEPLAKQNQTGTTAEFFQLLQAGDSPVVEVISTQQEGYSRTLYENECVEFIGYNSNNCATQILLRGK